MKARQLHSWRLTLEEARELQVALAEKVCRKNCVGEVRTIAGVDAAAGRSGELARAAVVVLDYPELTVREAQIAEGELEFPYVPGLLSFREAPLILQAFEKISVAPDLVIVDGQGIAHPRRFGIASHLGLLLDLPSIGCAKSILCGRVNHLPAEAGAVAPLIDKGETIGAAVRTKAGVRPVYVSIGHKVDLDAAVHWVLACCRGRRLPEPTRLADRLAAGKPIG